MYKQSILVVSLVWLPLVSTDLLLAAFAGQQDLSATPTSADPQQRSPGRSVKRRVLYNNDGYNILHHSSVAVKPTLENVHRNVDEVAGSQVDTLLICPCMGQLMLYPSKVVPMYGTGRKVPPNGGTVAQQGVRALRTLVAGGHDLLGLVIDRAKTKGLEVFITYRMNEVHDTGNPDSWITSPFWREHAEWRVTKTGTWSTAALNYAVPEVRRHMMDRLTEVLDLYGDRIDGLELDWQRFPSHFKKGEVEKNVPTLTQFMRDVRRMTDDRGKRRGRPILLAARVERDVARSRAIGLDPVAWAREGMIDILTVSRFLHNYEGPLDIKGFKQAVPNIPVYGCIEYTKSEADYRAEARKLWADGADGIYLFNFFCPREGGREPPFALLKELGDPKTIGQ